MQFKRLTLVLSAVLFRSFCWSKAKHTRTSLRVLDARSGTRVLRKLCCMLSVEPWLMSMAASISTTRPLSIRTTVESWLRLLASHIRGIVTKSRTRSSHHCLSADIQHKHGNYVCLCLASSLFSLVSCFCYFQYISDSDIVLCRCVTCSVLYKRISVHFLASSFSDRGYVCWWR